MNKKKIIKWLFILAVVGFAGVWFFVFKLPTTDWYRNFTARKGAGVTAVDIVKSYQTNESHSDSLFSDKVIEVSGIVKESKIENGKTSVWLNSSDSSVAVYFILKDSIEPLKAGVETIIKGKCSGFAGDVQFNEGVIIKK